jgi:hypothetical protein
MNWGMITAMIAVTGSIAIVASLLYVAQQMKAATRQRRIEWHHSIVGEVDGLSKLIAQDQANSDIWWRASKGIEHLTDAERVHYFAMLFIMFRSWEQAFRYGSKGVLDEWSVRALSKPLVDFAMSNGVQEYWALRQRWYAPDFREWVEKQMKERGGVDLYGEQFRIFGSADPKEGA